MSERNLAEAADTLMIAWHFVLREAPGEIAKLEADFRSHAITLARAQAETLCAFSAMAFSLTILGLWPFGLLSFVLSLWGAAWARRSVTLRLPWRAPTVGAGEWRPPSPSPLAAEGKSE